MKNLFDFATKELAQDAFLRWLFENYDCGNQEVEKCALRLLRAFSNNAALEKEDIQELTTIAQWKKIDVTVWFKVKNKDYLIAIEDKTASKEHEQLKGYNQDLLTITLDGKGTGKKSHFNVPSENVHKIFYKTGWILMDEEERVKENGWCSFDIDRICELYGDIHDTGDEILDGYLEHVRRIQKALKNTMIPSQHDETSIELAGWMGFFDQVLAKDIKQKYDVEIDISRYRYAYLAIFPRGHSKKCPYLEIRSRDIDKSQFSVRILTYIMYDKIKEEGEEKRALYRGRVQKILESVPAQNEGSRFFVKTRNGKEPKTLAKTKDIRFENMADMVDTLKKCEEEFDLYMKEWGPQIES